MITPESIDLKSLPSLPLQQKSKLPSKSGIYFAIDSFGSVQYIGLAKNIQHRWAGHHRYEELKQSDGVRIAYLLVSDVALLPEIEHALIAWFKPPLNKSTSLWSGRKDLSNPIPIEPSADEHFFTEEIRKRINKKGLTIYGLAKIIAEQQNIPVKTAHARVTRMLGGVPESIIY